MIIKPFLKEFPCKGKGSCSELTTSFANAACRRSAYLPRINPSPPDGYLVHLFNGGDPFAAKDYVRGKLGLASFKPNGAKARTITYDYRDPATGEDRYRKVRLDYTNGSMELYF